MPPHVKMSIKHDMRELFLKQSDSTSFILKKRKNYWVALNFLSKCIYNKLESCQWLVAGRLFSPGTPISSTNKTDRHDIIEIMFKVALNTITLSPPPLK